MFLDQQVQENGSFGRKTGSLDSWVRANQERRSGALGVENLRFSWRQTDSEAGKLQVEIEALEWEGLVRV